MQGCLSISTEQMANRHLSPFIQHVSLVQCQSWCDPAEMAKAGVWEVSDSLHFSAACLAPAEGVSNVASFWSSWKLPFVTVICLWAVGYSKCALLSAWLAKETSM